MEPRPNSWDQTQHNLYRILEEDHMSLMDIPEYADPLWVKIRSMLTPQVSRVYFSITGSLEKAGKGDPP